MQEYEKTIWSLLVLGALIIFGKALNSNEPITPRLLSVDDFGAGSSMMAGAALIWVLSLPAIAVGSVLGIQAPSGD